MFLSYTMRLHYWKVLSLPDFFKQVITTTLFYHGFLTTQHHSSTTLPTDWLMKTTISKWRLWSHLFLTTLLCTLSYNMRLHYWKVLLLPDFFLKRVITTTLFYYGFPTSQHQSATTLPTDWLMWCSLLHYCTPTSCWNSGVFFEPGVYTRHRRAPQPGGLECNFYL